jgi:hypothetical protein
MKRARKLIVHELDHNLAKDGKLHISTVIQPKLQRTLHHQKVEESRQEVKEYLQKIRKKIITVNFGTDGNIHAYVWRHRAPEPKTLPGWVFKRPVNQPSMKKR